MNRFRVTLIAVCLVLAWLAHKDISLYLRNPQPLTISIGELETLEKAPREWLAVSGGYPDFLQGINMTGSMEFEAFLVPLTSSADGTNYKVWFETRDPQILEALSTYYFLLDTRAQQQQFIEDNAHLFSGQRHVTGMTAAELVANSNQKKLITMLEQMGANVTGTPIFISEDKEPAVWRGALFALVAFAGMLKLTWDVRTRPQTPRI
ncbi:hypothetical protein [Pelovirga terrestris]|uniref:Uncharacterized protein n=1 Tax=Pelovirga terrestris TaxID=2771352 RepID=A0A8J6QKB8_9BACT|nr:hypothetical protein [Pelovirga terrestris]MBD1399769.1 hypothetical protein [Pelovirga terrestris]